MLFHVSSQRHLLSGSYRLMDTTVARLWIVMWSVDPLFAGTNCFGYLDFCKEKGTKGYPTFQIYKNGKLDSTYSGERTKDAFINALKPKETET